MHTLSVHMCVPLDAPMLYMCRYWNSMKQIIHTVSQVLTMIISLVALVAVFLFVYTIIGMRLFGGRQVVELPLYCGPCTYMYICGIVF